jgi:hypothetical protein
MAKSGRKLKIKYSTTIIIGYYLESYEVVINLVNQSYEFWYSNSVKNGPIFFCLELHFN